MASVTGRLLRVADDLRELRCDLHRLAIILLRDDEGLSHDAYTTLQMVFNRVGGLADLGAEEYVDGRYYLSPTRKEEGAA